MRYAVVNSDGLTVNTIVWDGVAPFDPGPGCSLVPEDQATPIHPPAPTASLRVRDVLNRLPPSKCVDILKAADATAASGDYQLRYLLLLLNAGDYLDRDDERMLGAFQSLVASGLLTQSEVDAALA
jgi:hypothetical protein